MFDLSEMTTAESIMISQIMLAAIGLLFYLEVRKLRKLLEKKI